MQRGSIMFEATHFPNAQQRRIVGDQLSHQVGTVECDRGEYGWPGTVGQQAVGYVFPNLFETGRPADHAELVVIIFAVDIRAGVDQPLDLPLNFRIARPSAARSRGRACRVCRCRSRAVAAR